MRKPSSKPPLPSVPPEIVTQVAGWGARRRTKPRTPVSWGWGFPCGACPLQLMGISPIRSFLRLAVRASSITWSRFSAVLRKLPPAICAWLTFRLLCVAVPEMDRRRMMLMTGIGALAAAIPVPEARAYPSGRVPPPTAPPGTAAQGTYLFHDEFDGPAGSAPDPSKWAVSRARESMQDPTFWELPENVGSCIDSRARDTAHFDGSGAEPPGHRTRGGKGRSPEPRYRAAPWAVAPDPTGKPGPRGRGSRLPARPSVISSCGDDPAQAQLHMKAGTSARRKSVEATFAKPH